MLRIRTAAQYQDCLNKLKSAQRAMDDGIRFTRADFNEIMVIDLAVARYEADHQDSRDYTRKR